MDRTHIAWAPVVALAAAPIVACNPSAGGEGTKGEVAEGLTEAVEDVRTDADPMVALREDPGDLDGPPVSRAVARLRPTDGRDAHGTVTFREEGGALEVRAELQGLPEGPHGYHVHLYGDCTGPDGKTAGTHFNFEGSAKDPGDVGRITGNLGELVAGEDGRASASTTLDAASLQGRFTLLGRSVVVHAKGNDPDEPPIGAAGARLACGVIGVDEAGG